MLDLTKEVKIIKSFAKCAGPWGFCLQMGPLSPYEGDYFNALLKYGDYARDSVPDYAEEDDYYPGEPAHVADPEVDIGNKRVANDVVDEVVDTKE